MRRRFGRVSLGRDNFGKQSLNELRNVNTKEENKSFTKKETCDNEGADEPGVLMFVISYQSFISKKKNK